MAILNKRPKDDAKTEQMINWSIFSHKITYVEFLCKHEPKFDYKTIRGQET